LSTKIISISTQQYMKVSMFVTNLRKNETPKLSRQYTNQYVWGGNIKSRFRPNTIKKVIQEHQTC